MEGPGISGLFRNVKTSLTQEGRSSHPSVPTEVQRRKPFPSRWSWLYRFLLSMWTHCSSSKPRIWIQVTIIYLGFTLMESLWLEPLEIFVQITQTSRSYFLALHRISMWPVSGSGSRSSENIWWVMVSDIATVPSGFGDVATVSTGLDDTATLFLQGLVTQPLSRQGSVMQPHWSYRAWWHSHWPIQCSGVTGNSTSCSYMILHFLCSVDFPHIHSWTHSS